MTGAFDAGEARSKVFLTSTEAAALWKQVTGSMSPGRLRRLFDAGELERLGVECRRLGADLEREVEKGSLLSYLVRVTRLNHERALALWKVWKLEQEELEK